MALEKLRERQRVRAVRAHAKRQRPNAAHREPTLERRGHRAAAHLHRGDALKQVAVLAEDQRAAQHVAVSAEVFRGGVHRDVGADLEGTLQNRGAPRVVDGADRAARDARSP